MKKMISLLLLALLFHVAASAQVKTYQMVTNDDSKIVNASDCVDRRPNSYLMWVRYDYVNKKACKKEARIDGVYGKPVRAEVLYEFDSPLLTYRIISKKYFDKNGVLLKELIYYNAPWNQVGDSDYSLKLGIYMTEAFNITAG